MPAIRASQRNGKLDRTRGKAESNELSQRIENKYRKKNSETLRVAVETSHCIDQAHLGKSEPTEWVKSGTGEAKSTCVPLL